MTVIPLRRPCYVVSPGPGGEPGGPGAEPEGFEKTYDGLMSAIALAKLLSAGGGAQDVLLVRGRKQKLLARFEAGGCTYGNLLPPVTGPPPRPAVIRDGSPHGHIPETCSTAKHRAAGTRPRRNPNMPKPSWPGIIT